MRDDYAPLARTYDQMARAPEYERMYRHWRRTLLDAARRRGVRVRVLVDLCCGTGNSTIPWTRRRGLTVIGVDRSPSQLREARRKSRAVRWVRQDVTKLALRCQADAVTSHFDALNHLLTPRALGRAFANVAGILNDGGLFVFDLNTSHMLEWLRGREKMFAVGPHVFMASNTLDERTGIATFHQTWFVKHGRSYVRRDVRVRERAYTDREVIDLLGAAGLRLVETNVQVSIEGKPSRKVYVAQKTVARAARVTARRSSPGC